MGSSSITTWAALAAVVLILYERFQSYAPQQYMDEVFHVPQAQRFCNGDFQTWDPKITTLPGLYLISSFIARILSTLTGLPQSWLCTIEVLRGLNAVFLLLLFPLFCAILRHEANRFAAIRLDDKITQLASSPSADLDKDEDDENANRGSPEEEQPKSKDIRHRKPSGASSSSSGASSSSSAPSAATSYFSSLSLPSVSTSLVSIRAITIISFPVLFFFGFLYYTDAGSTFFVCLMYYLSLRGYHMLASATGLITILFRQTNVVWVAFCAAISLVDAFEQNNTATGMASASLSSVDPAAAVPAVEEKLSFYQKTLKNLKPIGHFFKELSHLFGFALKTRKGLTIALPYAIVCSAFVAFVIWNGSIVVGDKLNHESSFHPAQLLYFFTFAAAMMPGQLLLPSYSLPSSPSGAAPKSLLVASISALYRRIRTSGWITMVILWRFFALSFFVLQRYSHVHQFIVADNRHYTFYIYKNFFREIWWLKYAFIPVHLVAAVSLFYSLSQASRKHRLWITAFLACTAASLVPASLVEPRYFVIPTLLLCLNFNPGNLLRPSSTQASPSFDAASASSLSPPSSSNWRLSQGAATIGDLVYYALINAVTIYVFLTKPFVGPDGQEARFMW